MASLQGVYLSSDDPIAQSGFSGGREPAGLLERCGYRVMGETLAASRHI